MKLALRGPALSGKTTLANYLHRRYGFTVIRYNDILKKRAALALSHIGRKTTLADIRRDKEVYRPFLQELGSLLHFDEGAFIDEAVASVRGRFLEDSTGRLLGDVVFDNVRFLAQWEKLRAHGFQLVKLDLSPSAQMARAEDNGLPVQMLGRSMKHPAELGFPHQPGEILVDASYPTKDIAKDILAMMRWEGAA
jgi:hypothetical protein